MQTQLRDGSRVSDSTTLDTQHSSQRLHSSEPKFSSWEWAAQLHRPGLKTPVAAEAPAALLGNRGSQ